VISKIFEPSKLPIKIYILPSNHIIHNKHVPHTIKSRPPPGGASLSGNLWFIRKSGCVRTAVFDVMDQTVARGHEHEPSNQEMDGKWFILPMMETVRISN
jgi:hypothetical protein